MRRSQHWSDHSGDIGVGKKRHGSCDPVPCRTLAFSEQGDELALCLLDNLSQVATRSSKSVEATREAAGCSYRDVVP